MIGKKLKEIREEKRLGICKTANAANISRQALCNIEQGKSDPKASTIELIAEALGMSIFFAPKVNCSLLDDEQTA